MKWLSLIIFHIFPNEKIIMLTTEIQQFTSKSYFFCVSVSVKWISVWKDWSYIVLSTYSAILGERRLAAYSKCRLCILVRVFSDRCHCKFVCVISNYGEYLFFKTKLLQLKIFVKIMLIWKAFTKQTLHGHTKKFLF